jgi:hypothetical protein
MLFGLDAAISGDCGRIVRASGAGTERDWTL